MLAKKLFILLIATLLLLPNSFAFAETSRFTAPNDDIDQEARERMIHVTTGDVDGYVDFSSWLNKQESFILERQTKNHTTIFFNAPSLQKSIMNTIQVNNVGGWSLDQFNSLNDNKDEKTWTTAEKKYGWHLPFLIYKGEQPVVTLELKDIADDALNPVNVVRVSGQLIIEKVSQGVAWIAGLFGQEVNVKSTDFTAGLTPRSLRNMKYHNHDYYNTDSKNLSEVGQWLKENWSIWAKHKDELDINIGENKNLFETDITDGGTALPDAVLGKFVQETGTSYAHVIMMLGRYNEAHDLEICPAKTIFRFMPYDLISISPSSQQYMNNIPDERVRIFHDDGFLGWKSTSATMIGNIIFKMMPLGFVEFMTWISNILNSICDFSILKDKGIDITMFWGGTIGEFIIVLLLISAILWTIIAVIKMFLTGNIGIKGIIGRAMMTAVFTFLAVGILMNPKQASDLVINTSSKVMNITAQAIQEDSFKQLKTSGASPKDVSSLRYWYLYFDTWGKFETSSSINDPSAKFDIASGRNEYTQLKESPAQLVNGQNINLWQAALLEYAKNNDDYGIYRVSDHYLAPEITPGDFPNFSVERNKFYTKPITEFFPFTATLICILVFMATVIKVMCFIEFITDFVLLSLRFVVGVFEGKNVIMSGIKSLGQSLFRIIFYDLFITVFIWETSMLTPEQLFPMAVLETAGFVYLICYIYKFNNNILCPAIFPKINSTIAKVKENYFEANKIHLEKKAMLNKLSYASGKEVTMAGKAKSLKEKVAPSFSEKKLVNTAEQFKSPTRPEVDNAQKDN